MIAARIVSEPAPAILCIKRKLFLTIAGYHVTAPGTDSGNRLLRLRAIGDNIARQTPGAERGVVVLGAHTIR